MKKVSTEAVVEHVRAEHARWLRKVGDVDPYLGRTTIGIKEALRAHFLLAEYFAATGEGLGGIGPKNLDLLHSALFRQVSEFGGHPRWSERLEVCASLMYGLIRNHPFHDANKRTAFLTALLHLQKVGRMPTVEGQAFEDFTVAIADRNLDAYPYFQRTSGSDDERDIATIAHFLRRNSREINLQHKLINYKRLTAILTPHGLALASPLHNRIDLVRVRTPEGKDLVKPVRLTRIGFRSWTTEVSAKDMHIIRAAAHLEAGDGYDSEAFFNGVQSPLQLIRKYKEPLERLAYR
jgi:death-on-curing protein